VVPTNPRINADARRLVYATLDFKALLYLFAYSTLKRAPVMRQAVKQLETKEK